MIVTLLIEIKVIPNASRFRWKLDPSGRLVAYITSPPVDGKANKELVDRLSEALSIPKRSVMVAYGETGRLKKISLEGILSFDEVLARLGLEKQMEFAES